MANFIVIKNNILKKKGTFFSVVLLTVIVVMTASMIFSVRDNYSKAMEEALNGVNAGNTIYMINEHGFDEDILKKVEESSLVKGVNKIETVVTNTNNAYFMQKLRPGIKLFSKDEKSYEENIPPLKRGEIYIPLGVKDRFSCEVGDTISLEMLDKTRSFIIKGFILEPCNGASTIGWKQVFINDEEFEEIRGINKAMATDEASANYIILNVYKADESLSDLKFQRLLNRETKIGDYAFGSMAQEQSSKYTLLFFEITSMVVLVFTALLWVIVLIVISNSITTEIENDYANIGVLKSIGFNEKRVRFIISMQYIIAGVFGIIIGNIIALPLSKVVGNIFIPITSLVPDNGISVIKVLALSLVLLIMMLMLVVIKTRKIVTISPVKVMNKSNSDVHFDNIFTIPISKRNFSFTMSFRNFTSNMRRYMGTMFIVALLTFFMLTANLMVGMISSESAMDAMGLESTDIDIGFIASTEKDIFVEIEQLIEEYSPIDKKYYLSSKYMSLEGENLICRQYYHPEYIGGILKGRAPLYDNEVLISDMVAESLELKMGDEVTVSEEGYSAKYIISGIYQTSNDAGMAFAMSCAGAKRLNASGVNYMGIKLENNEKKEEIVERLNSELGHVIKAQTMDFEELIDEFGFGAAVTAIELIIYSMSVIFMLVVVCMVCAKSFAYERVNIGILKALGITSKKLRILFAIRFLIVAVIGALLGTVLSAFLSDLLLNNILSLIGLTSVVTKMTVLSVCIPILVAGITFFVFAYMASAKVRKVEVRELICE